MGGGELASATATSAPGVPPPPSSTPAPASLVTPPALPAPPPVSPAGPPPMGPPLATASKPPHPAAKPSAAPRLMRTNMKKELTTFSSAARAYDGRARDRRRASLAPRCTAANARVIGPKNPVTTLLNRLSKRGLDPRPHRCRVAYLRQGPMSRLAPFLRRLAFTRAPAPGFSAFFSVLCVVSATGCLRTPDRYA